MFWAEYAVVKTQRCTIPGLVGLELRCSKGSVSYTQARAISNSIMLVSVTSLNSSVRQHQVCRGRVWGGGRNGRGGRGS